MNRSRRFSNPNLPSSAFTGNDVIDNLLPIASRYEVVDRLGRLVYIRPFRFDAWDNLIPIDESTARYFAVHGVYPPANDIERLLGSARMGTLLLRLRDSIAEIGKAERRLAKGVELTRLYLRQLRESAASHDSALLVVLIPYIHELTGKSERYDIAVALMEELELTYMSLKNVMIVEEDYAPVPDGHWTNAGHQKVGALLSDCVEVFIDNGNLGDCEHVVMP